jgi:DNA-binding NtrC family response regulator
MTIQRSIFYLDDDPAQLDIFLEMFGSEHNVRTSTDLRDAFRVLTQYSPEIIISDQSLPGMRGTDFLRAVVKLCPDSVRVLLTGQVSLGEVFTEVASGTVQLFISKPWREREMRDALERAGTMSDTIRGAR